MCPDSETLSAYYDGELDLYWRNQISAHLAGCEGCRKRVRDFKTLSDTLPELDTEILQISQDQQWRQLRLAVTHSSPRTDMFRRRVAVPIPLLAAAALALFFLAGFGVVQQRANHRLTLSMQERPENISVELSYQSLQQLKTLADMITGSQAVDNGTEVFLTVPSHPVFQTNGTPQVVRSIDVSRGN